MRTYLKVESKYFGVNKSISIMTFGSLNLLSSLCHTSNKSFLSIFTGYFYVLKKIFKFNNTLKYLSYG